MAPGLPGAEGSKGQQESGGLTNMGWMHRRWYLREDLEAGGCTSARASLPGTSSESETPNIFFLCLTFVFSNSFPADATQASATSPGWQQTRGF